MNTRRRYFRILIGLVLVALPAAGASEETADIYESITDTTIGPVFLTPAQRAWLDRQRQLAPAAAVSSSTAKPTGAVQSSAKKPAGYILSSRGRRSEWSDGDFVESAAASTPRMAFPGEVDLLRHDPDTDDDQVDDRDDENDR